MTDHDKTSKLFIECLQKHKALWVQASRQKNMKLEQWVNETLTEAALRMDLPAPAWMDFSKRTTDALLSAHIRKESELIERIEEDTLFNIQDFGPRCVAEVKAWYDERK